MRGRRIAITGASGNIGAKLRAALTAAWADLLLIDRVDHGDPTILSTDLSLFPTAGGSSWVAALAGVDTLVHLAADPRLDAPWARLERDNLDATLNVLEAARQQQVRRVVLASSVQTAIARVGHDALIDTVGPGAPVNLYGVSKCVAERLGAHYARHCDLSVIALRIGWVQPGENRPGPHLGPLDHQHLWLGNQDCCSGIASAILAPDTIRFGVFNLLSDNAGMPWDLTATTGALGWRPAQSSVPVTPKSPPSRPASRVTQPLRRLPHLLRRWLIRRWRSKADDRD